MKDAWDRRDCIVCVGRDDDSISADRFDPLMHALNADEQRRLATFTRPDRRRQFVLGHALLRHMLGASGINATIVVAEDGAPALEHLGGHLSEHRGEHRSQTSQACISLSHSGAHFAAALFPGPIGIDLEAPRRFRDPEHALDLLGEDASTANRAIDADDQARRAWVLAEARFKARRGKPNEPLTGPWRTQWDGCELAIAGCPQAPSTFLVDLRHGRYNPLQLQWRAVA